jgi:hypothetical protein
VPNLVRALRDYEPLCEPVLWFRHKMLAGPQYYTTAFFQIQVCQVIRVLVSRYYCSGSREDPTGGQPSLESLHRCKTRQLTVSLVFFTTEIGMCHLSDTILNSSDVLAVLKHDLQLSALTSPSAFNQQSGPRQPRYG